MASDQRIRVLFVSKWLDVGGAERFVSTVLTKLDPERFDAHLVLFRNIVGYPLPQHVSVKVLDRDLIHRHWHVPRLVVRLARALRELRPDVVVSAYSYPNIVTGLALRLVSERPRWLARISTNPEWEDVGLRRTLSRFAYGAAQRFVANSAGLGELFSSIYSSARGRTWHLPNPTDFDAIEDATKQPPEVPPSTRLRLVSVGRFAAAKRVDLLVEMMDRLRRHHDVELVLCGDGELRSELESSVDQLGLSRHVVFAGYGNPFPWVASADLFVLSSDHEGSPNALIEAQGLGIPAVSTDCDFGPSEIIDNGVTGWLVPVGAPEALSKAIERAISDPQRLAAAGAAARRRARELFDAYAVTKLLARHLEDLCVDSRRMSGLETLEPEQEELGEALAPLNPRSGGPPA